MYVIVHVHIAISWSTIEIPMYRCIGAVHRMSVRCTDWFVELLTVFAKRACACACACVCNQFLHTSEVKVHSLRNLLSIETITHLTSDSQLAGSFFLLLSSSLSFTIIASSAFFWLDSWDVYVHLYMYIHISFTTSHTTISIPHISVATVFLRTK